MPVKDIKEDADGMKGMAEEYRDKHAKSASILKVVYYLFGGIDAILTGVTALVVFPNFVAEDSLVGFILAIIATVASTILVFYSLAVRAQCHSKMEIGFENLTNRLRIFSMVDCSPNADETELNKKLVAYKLELKDLLNESVACRAFKIGRG